MRKPPHNAERYRLTHAGVWTSRLGDGNNGAFLVPFRSAAGFVELRCLASDGGGWDHVSVSLPDRCPTYEEMDAIKKLFWQDNETVMQLHVPTHLHVNYHPYCLHLWKPQGKRIPLPPPDFVGPLAHNS